MGIRFTAKTTRFFRATLIVSLSFSSLCSIAQTVSADPPYSIVDRVLQRTVSVTNVTGSVSQQVQSYTDLGDGMNYLSNGQWVQAQDLVEVTAEGAQAVHGQMKANFSGDITSVGAISLTTAAGEVFQSHPIGLFYMDSASGKVAQIAAVQSSVGTLYPPNVIVFSNVLSGLRADLMLVWAKNGFEQNLVLKQNPPPPGSFSMSSSTTTLQLWTAMDSCPVPQEQRPVLLPSGLEDHILIFGGTWFPVGAAFAFGNAFLAPNGQAAQVRLIRPSDPGTVPTAKSLLSIAGQEVLIEEVRYSDLATVLSQLPQASLSPKPSQTAELADRGKFLRPLPKSASSSLPMQVASTKYTPKGVVLDYSELSGSVNTYTLTNGSTYHIASSFSVGPGTTYFQQNACVKLDTNAYFLVYGNVSCSTSGSPTVFTSRDDNDYGTMVTNSTANPGYAAAEAIWMYFQTVQTTLQNLSVRWAQTGIRYDAQSLDQPHLNSSSFQNCPTGVLLSISGSDTFYLSQVTSCNVPTPLFDESDGGTHISGSITLNCGDTDLPLPELQHESTVTINPSDPSKVAIFAADFGADDPTNGVLKVTSSDGGNTWSSPVLIATGSSGDGLPAAKEDVQAAYDATGNLFLCYTTPNLRSNILARSRDGGATWSVVRGFLSSNADRPVLATGPGGTNASASVWVLYIDGNALTLAGAPVDSNGNVGSFMTYTPGCSSNTVSTGLAVGPTGEVVMAYESRSTTTLSNRLIYINVDSDGLGPSQATNGCAAQIPVNMDFGQLIPAQPDRGIYRVPVLAWDRCPTSPYSNRVYLAFADTQTTNSNDYNTDIYVMHSDNENRASWSTRLKVNDDSTTNSQFFPGIAVDQTTGLIAVSWYDCRNDSGNTNTQFFAAVSRDGFATRPANFQLTMTNSYSHQSACSLYSYIVNYGDYTGLAFNSGYFFPTWCSYANTTDSCGDVRTCKVAW